MSFGLWGQFIEFLLTFVFGIFLAMLFHFHQQFVAQSKIGGAVLIIFDCLMWMLFLVLTFSALLIINQGDMRFYILLALALAALFYYLVLQKRFSKLIIRLAQIATGALRSGYNTLTVTLKKIIPTRTPPSE